MDHDAFTEDSDNLTGAWPPVLVGFLLVVVVGGVTDIVLDRPASWFTAHVAVELGMVLVSLSFAVLIFSRWRRSQQALQQTRASLAATTRALAERQAERDRWRAMRTPLLAALDINKLRHTPCVEVEMIAIAKWLSFASR